jgi:hypothetical protein
VEEVRAFHARPQAAYQRAVTARSAKLVPLELPELPEPLSGDPPEQLSALKLAQVSTSSGLIARALGTASLVQALVQHWQDAEKQRSWHSYLRTAGAPEPLSAEWLTALREAGQQIPGGTTAPSR